MEEFDAHEAAKAVRVQLARQGINQAELERRLGVSRGTVSRALAGSPLDERSTTWRAMLDALDLEIVVRSKQLDETDAVLADHPDILDRIARLERGETKLTPLREVAEKYGVELRGNPVTVSRPR